MPLPGEDDLDALVERLAAEATGGCGGRVSERRYLAPLPLGGDEGPPWSKGLMTRALAATGLTPTRAYELAVRADADMTERRALELDLDRLAEIAAEVLGEPDAGVRCAACAACRRCSTSSFRSSCSSVARPGTGKSTLATEAAHRLGITRVTSTDFIRQTMRAFFSREFMPSVHYSSFEAELALTHADEDVATTRRCSASSTRRATCSWASRRRSTAR